MQSDLNTTTAYALDSQSGVSWAAIAAGAVANAALTLVLVAFGAGLGLSAISPWSDTGVSAATFKTGTGIYLVVVAVMASAVGGYLAARLRTRLVGLHTNEVYFRDTAHGFLAWAFAAVLSASVLGAAIAHLANGAVSGLAAGAPQAARAANPQEIYVDKLLRTENAAPAPAAAAPTATPAAGEANPAQAPASNTNNSRAEVLRLWTASIGAGQDLTPDDRTYLAHVVAARTGLSQADAQKRVDAVVTEAKAAADQARRGAMKLSFWLTAALLFGAFAASLAAVEGGQLRDGSWNDRVLVPRTL
ncbi:MAG: hypothetical protein WAK63_12895 [Xanthobacteraceae bacterium]